LNPRLSVVRRPHRWGLRIAILVSILIGLVPAAWPVLDLRVAALFYDAAQGFWLQDTPVVNVIYVGITWLARGALLAIAAGLVLQVLQVLRSRRDARVPSSVVVTRGVRRRQALACALLSLVIGPGLLINVLLKEHIGRARPEQVEPFGGDRVFSAALRQANQCEHNCAFVSGHAAVGFWLATGYAISRRRQRGWLWAGTTAGFAVGLVRIVAGGHWFSDITFSMTFTLVGVGLAYLLAYRPRLRWRLARARLRATLSR